MKLVSAILPTRARPDYAALALDSFMKQTYSHRELIILDDDDAPSFPNSVAKLDGVHYLRLNERLSIPAKRNQCCAMASGEILMHFDSDDWSAPERMADQVSRLEESGKAVTGYNSMLFHVEQSDRWLKYVNNDPGYALGTSLCFTKEWWASHPFQPGNEGANVGEDNLFVREARKVEQLTSVDAGAMMFARAHPGNTSVKRFDNMEYRRVDLSCVPKGFSA